MKKWLCIIFLLSLTQMGFGQLPNIQLKDLDGQTVILKEQLGEKLTVIDFWATWCKPCVAAIPKLSQLAEEYNAKEVAFWGINIDSPRNRSKVKPFVNSLNISYPVFLDADQELMGDLNVHVMPTLLIVDSNGKVRYFHEGFQAGDEKRIKSEITKLLTSSK